MRVAYRAMHWLRLTLKRRYVPRVGVRGGLQSYALAEADLAEADFEEAVREY